MDECYQDECDTLENINMQGLEEQSDRMKVSF